jgi:MFS family permease
VQAASGAGFTPSATGIIVDHFGDDRDRAVSLFGSIFPIGAMIGPLFGGLFVSYWTWRGVFFVNVPIGVAVIVLAMRYVPQDRPPEDKSGFWRDGATIASGMLLLAFRPSAAIPPYVWLTGSAFLVGAGAGAINPASRNAGLQLAPLHSSTLAALRSASLQIGSIVTVSIVTAILAGSDDPGRTQARVFVAVGLLLVAALPLIRRVPDQRGAW